MIDLQPQHMVIVKDILQKWVPDAEVWAFGSRVKGNARPSSDLDIVVIAAGALDIRTINRLAEEFEDSLLPIRVDVLDWHTVSEKFRMVIQTRYEVLQKGGEDYGC